MDAADACRSCGKALCADAGWVMARAEDLGLDRQAGTLVRVCAACAKLLGISGPLKASDGGVEVTE